MLEIINKIKRRMYNMFKLTKESGLTKVWVSLVLGGTYTFQQVPNLFNLKEAVGEVLKDVGVIESK